MKGEGGRGKGEDESALRATLSGFPLPPSPFRLLLDPPAAGPWNMAVDEALLETAAADGQCTLRLYRWQEPTLSLGYFQNYGDRWQHAESSRAAVVRRPSGGGAILHDREVTYSLAIPSRHLLAVRRLECYEAVHVALVEVLAQWGIQAMLAARSEHPAVRHEPFLCFQRRSPGDVLVGGSKIGGSAQRRAHGAVLQHGSVLLARSAAAPQLAGLEDVSGQAIPPDRLIKAWLIQLADVLSATWQDVPLSGAERHRAALLSAEKYASPVWTEHRGRVSSGA